MIQKRYEYMGPKGIVWTQWFDTSKDDSELLTLQKEIWHVKNKLRCEYRLK